MKRLIPYLTLLTISGCNASGGSSSLVSSVSSGCPEKPTVALSEKDVEEILINEQTLTKSGQASATKSTGYKFEAKSGEKLSFSTDSNICIWVYSPDNEIIGGGNLSKNGKYILQVLAPKGSTTFDLKMSLGILQASSKSTASLSSNASSTQAVTATSGNDLTQGQALEIVKKWYEAKPRIFAPPFDTGIVEQLTTGKLYQKTTASDPEVGPVAWLRSKNFYYTYTRSGISNVIDFSNSGKQPYIKVRIFEELYLHTSKGIDSENSGSHKGDFIYFFEKENEIWKIYDYKKVN